MIPNSAWPLWEAFTGNKRLQDYLSRVPAEKLAPAPQNVFRALELTAPEDVKVIIIGQDPYIRGEAHGLSFSSPGKMTPSLRIVFEEVREEYMKDSWVEWEPNTDLTRWATQGVLLLNTVLTTELGVTLAHEKFGWQDFTKEVVRYVINLGNPMSVMLWGKHAQEFYSSALDKTIGPSPQIQVLNSVHPQAQNYNPSKKFVGNNHFRKANDWLASHGKSPINWL